MNIFEHKKNQNKMVRYPVFFDRVKIINQSKVKKKQNSKYYKVNNINFEQFYKAIIKL